MKYAQSPETQQYLVHFWTRYACFAEIVVTSDPANRHLGALSTARRTPAAKHVNSKYGAETVFADVHLVGHPWDREMFKRTEVNGPWTRIVPESEQALCEQYADLESQITALSDNYDTLDARVTALETEVGIHATRLDTVEGQTGVLIAQVGALETQADDFEERIADLEDNLLGGWL